MTMATVKEIQVYGGRVIAKADPFMLSDMCFEYIECIKNGTDREKLNFVVTMPDGQVKTITFRQEDDGIVVYGDFEGLPSMLDYAKEVAGGKG